MPALAKGGFYHAGQVCVSVQRVFAHSSIVAELGERLAERASRLKVGDPLSPETEVGPLIRPSEVVRVHGWVEEAVAGGGGLLCGGSPVSETCYSPTVILEPPAECRLSTEEVFGPVVCIYAYDDLDDASREPTLCLGLSRRRSSPATTTRRCAPTAGSTPRR